MPHSADRLKVFVAMARVFQILISLLALPGQTGVGTTDTMNLGKITSESAPEPSAHHITYTDFNVMSANVHPQTVGTITNRGNVAIKATHGQSVETAMNTGNVASLVGGAVPADIVARDSVPGQTTGSQTVRSTTVSAVNSDLDQTVTADSGNIGTVPTSVQIRRENEDLTSESVFTSTTVTTVPAAVSTLITTSPVTPTQHCEAMLCEKDAGYFVINTTACAANDSPAIDTSIPTTVEILTNVNSAMSDILCYWNIKVPDRNYINVTIDQRCWKRMKRMKVTIPKHWISTWKTMSTSHESSICQC